VLPIPFNVYAFLLKPFGETMLEFQRVLLMMKKCLAPSDIPMPDARPEN
jgi:hypothetical protein